jgi:hypothetical protein
MDVQAVSDALNLTWMTHWQHVEEQHQFRRQVFASTRGRQVQRQQWLLDAVADPGAASDDDDSAQARIVNGRFSIVPQPRGAAAPAVEPAAPRGPSDGSAGEDMDELTWLASHPEALGQAAEGDGAEGGAPAAAWTQAAAQQAAASGAVQLRVGSESVAVRPLWICVHQPEGAATAARLFESVVPLQEELIQRLSAGALEPFCSVSGLEFGAFADVRHGAWANFFVGLVGDVAVEESDILWPNQILHRDRVLYNVRDAGDVARFLADPRRADVEEHLANLERLSEERRYRRGWAWHMLRSRWGKPALDQFGVKLLGA